MVHIKHLASSGFFDNGLLGLPLRTYKEYRTTLCGNLLYIVTRSLKHPQRFLKIYNINTVALSENVFRHFRIPTSRLVTKVNS